jgi:RNA polymerase sigma-70 factor (ECF subfamily)
MTDRANSPKRLDEIPTQWSLLRLAQQDSVTLAGPARSALALRYSSSIRHYVGAQVKDQQDADELAQEVLVRILRGSFNQANPERGRFRDLLKVAVRNMVRTYWTRKHRRSGVNLDVEQIAQADEDDDPADQEWIAAWRHSVLDKAWAALEHYQLSHKGSVSFTLLRLRVDHPDDDSERLAARLSEALGRKVRPEAARQQLHRARLRFAQLLLEEVARLLDNPTPERVEEELIEIGLIEYVRDFLPDDWRTRGELKPRG